MIHFLHVIDSDMLNRDLAMIPVSNSRYRFRFVSVSTFRRNGPSSMKSRSRDEYRQHPAFTQTFSSCHKSDCQKWFHLKDPLWHSLVLAKPSDWRMSHDDCHHILTPTSTSKHHYDSTISLVLLYNILLIDTLVDIFYPQPIRLSIPFPRRSHRLPLRRHPPEDPQHRSQLPWNPQRDSEIIQRRHLMRPVAARSPET
jgi:hypothetical protein